jgi:type IV pilus assembly protein PilQ
MPRSTLKFRLYCSHDWAWHCLVVICGLTLVLVSGVGCVAPKKVERKTIDQLYREAIKESIDRPPVIQPATIHARLSGDPSSPSGSYSASTTTPFQPVASQIAQASWQVVDAGRDPLDERISEIFEQTDIQEALSILSSAAKQSIIVDDSVGGITSAQIENDTFEQALEKVLMPLGLVYTKRGDKYIVSTGTPDSPLFSQVADRFQYQPQNHSAQSLVGLLPPRYKPYYQVSNDRDMIVIEAHSTKAKEILERLEELDQPVPQVELEAIVCVTSPDKGFRFGLDWGHVVGVQGIDSLKAGMTGLSFSGTASREGLRDTFADFAVTSAFVRLLAQEGYITIRAAPRVTTKDGEKAQISISRETFFSLQPANSNLLFRQDVQKVESGISLDIVPRVYGDMVSCRIAKAEVSEDIRTQDSRTELTTNPFPIINRRQVSTDVVVRDGHTVVIGGLVQRQTVDRVNRIPGLSRIPLLGKLFQTVEKQEQDAEVAIFISPRIVPAESPTVNPNYRAQSPSLMPIPMNP